MVKEPEILNIAHHRRLLIWKALNKYPTQKEAAKKLGITTRHLNRECIRLGFVLNKGSKTWKQTQAPFINEN